MRTKRKKIVLYAGAILGILALALVLRLALRPEGDEKEHTQTRVQTEQPAAQDTETGAETVRTTEEQTDSTEDAAEERLTESTETEDYQETESSHAEGEVPEGTGDASQGGTAQEGSVQEPGGTQTGRELTFPYLLEDGRISVSSIFPYTGLNPDAGWQTGENIASLEFTNASDEYLESIEITAGMGDGRSLTFAAEKIPAGQTVWIFEKKNESYDQQKDICVSLESRAAFAPEAPLMGDAVETAADGTAVTLTNRTAGTQTGLTVYCHCLFQGFCFGGTAFSYPVPDIPAGGSVTVDAMDCYLGDALVTEIQ